MEGFLIGIKRESVYKASESTTNKLPDWSKNKTYLTQNNNLYTNSVHYFYNFVLISFKIIILSFDKLQIWYNKFTVLITTILTSVILFKSEKDGNESFLKAVYATATMYKVLTEHIVIQLLKLKTLDFFWIALVEVLQIWKKNFLLDC